MAFAFQIKGIQETIKKFDNYPDRVKQDVDDELTATAYEIIDAAKLIVPVDLGALKNSLNVTRNEPLLKWISATASYAAYVEFGTGTGVRITGVPGLESYALQFKGRGIKKLNLFARPYFFPAYQAKTHDLLKRLKKIIEDEAKKK